MKSDITIKLPFDGEYPVTQIYGVPFMYNGKLCKHMGVDYGLPKRTRLLAPFKGKVTRTTPERNTGYGKAIYIESEECSKGKYQAILAHCNEIIVEEGFKVDTGKLIGYSGRSGFWRGVNGYHLHFGLSLNFIFFDPLTKINKSYVAPDKLFSEQEDHKNKAFFGSHTVAPGDTLWHLAEKYYNNGALYMEIFNANADLLSSPHLIKPGQLLRIPALINKGI